MGARGPLKKKQYIFKKLVGLSTGRKRLLGINLPEKSDRLSIELEKLAPAVLRRLQILEAEGPTSFERRCERLLRSRGSA